MKYSHFIPLISLIILSVSCTGPKEISSKGLKYAKIGMEMPQEGQKRLKGHALRDTVFNEGGYTWRASILKLPKGKVYLEEDFTGTNTVGRIRIQTPVLKFQDAYSVGMPAKELTALSKGWYAFYLEDYGLLDFSCDEFPQLHFLVKDTEYPADPTKNAEIRLKDLTNTSKIVAIVVM